MLCQSRLKPNPKATSSRKPSLRAEFGGLFWASWVAALLPGSFPLLLLLEDTLGDWAFASLVP